MNLIYNKKLGSGTYGTVYSARINKKNIAVKIINNQTKKILNSFKKEKDILNYMKKKSDINKQYVISSIKLINLDNSKFIAFPFYPYTLLDLIYKMDYSNLEITMFIGNQICKALTFIHKYNIIHRDIKPSNIMVNYNMSCKLIDFGNSCFSNIKDNLKIIQPLWYRAPEVLLGNHPYTNSVDIWSFGCILYEIYKKHVLFKGNYLDPLDEYDQFVRICEVDFIGLPSNKIILNSKKSNYYFNDVQLIENNKYRLPKSRKLNIEKKLKDILIKIFVFDINKRPNSEQILDMF